MAAVMDILESNYFVGRLGIWVTRARVHVHCMDALSNLLQHAPVTDTEYTPRLVDRVVLSS